MKKTVITHNIRHDKVHTYVKMLHVNKNLIPEKVC